jgi:hypothetical protein
MINGDLGNLKCINQLRGGGTDEKVTLKWILERQGSMT